MRKLVYGMNMSVDGYVATVDGDIDWSAPSDELFEWWLEQERGISLFLYGRRLWDMMSSYWPTGDERPGVTPAQVAYAENWRETPKVVFSSTLDSVGWNARLFDGDAVAEIARLKAEEGGPMRVAGPELASAAVRAGLVDEYEVVTHPVLLGGGTPFLPTMDERVRLELTESRAFPGGATLNRYAVRR